MRIAKETSHNDVKVTIMVMNGKYCLKLEKNLLEQTYKFRDGSGFDSVDKIESVLNDDFYENIDLIFNTMSGLRLSIIQDNYISGQEFEKII